MRSSTIFWGVFLISLGILFLFIEFGTLGNHLGFVINLWPLLLVLWGLSLLKIPKWGKETLVGLTGLFLALFIAAIFSGGWNFFRDFRFSRHFYEDGSSRYESGSSNVFLSNPYRNIANASLNVEAGAGEMEFTGSTDKMIDVNYFGNANNIVLTEDSTTNVYTLDMTLHDGKGIFHNGKSKRRAEVKLNPNVNWNLDLQLGAFDFKGDLSAYRTSNIKLGSGAADVDLKVGNRSDTINIEVDAGASDINIDIPSGSACEIVSETGLSGNHFNGFTEISDNVYRTENFGKSAKMIRIKISGGISDFEVTRY